MERLHREFRRQARMEMYAQFAGDWSDYFHDYRWRPLPGGAHTARWDCLATPELTKTMALTPFSGPFLKESCHYSYTAHSYFLYAVVCF